MEESRTTLRIVTWKPENPAAWEEVIRGFEQTHPGLRVEREIGPNSSTQLHDLLTQKLRNRDSSVDAFLMDVVWTPEFAAAGWVLPVDDLVPPRDRDAFFPAAIEADTVGGRLYGVPLNIDGGVLYFRSDLLRKHGLAPPRTWSELALQAEAIRNAEGDPRLWGYSAQLKQYEGLICNVLELVGSNGGDLLRPESREAVEAITFVRDRIVGGIAPRGVLTYEEQESLDLFLDGGSVFLRSWPYAWAILRSSPLSGSVGIAPLPSFVPGRSTSALGGWRFGISPFSRHAVDARELVLWLTGPEAQRVFAIEEGKAPSRRALYRDEEVLRANPHFADLLPIFETATPRPRTPLYPRVSHVLQRTFHAAISDSRSDIPALAAEAAREIDRVAGGAR